MTDWRAWHADCADASSLLSERLRLVQRRIGDWLDATAPGPVTVLSSCAGDGRDLLEVLAARSDADRVTATLIEADPRNAASASEHAGARSSRRHGQVRQRRDEQHLPRRRPGRPRAAVRDLRQHRRRRRTPDDRRHLQLCSRGARVIWTRHRRDPDLTPRVRGWFDGAGFRGALRGARHAIWSVGVRRFVGTPWPLARGQHLFTFVR